MDIYNEWIGPNIITPPTTQESFTLDFKQYAEALGQPESKILLNNRWGVKVYPVSAHFLACAYDCSSKRLRLRVRHMCRVRSIWLRGDRWTERRRQLRWWHDPRQGWMSVPSADISRSVC